MKIPALAVLLVLLAGCAADPVATTGGTPTPADQPPAEQVLQAIKWRDWPALAGYVHSQGVRFPPYGYVTDADRRFTAEQVRRLRLDIDSYEWGSEAGTGGTMTFSFDSYYRRFIYDRDYLQAPQRSTDTRLGMGNAIDNTRAYYPGARVVEFYFPGSSGAFSGDDWSSLRLVFLRDNGVWRLAGVVHDQCRF